jgi:hypothetical protein
MSPDPAASKAFYDAVVGWNVSEPVEEFQGYRMIGRSDGRFAGGVLPLTDDMQQHGARAAWLAYVGVDDVDAAVSSIEQAGGKTLLPARDLPNVGRIAMVADPQGAPFYVMKPAPRQDDPNAVSDVFSPDAEQRVGWNELLTNDVESARRFYGEQFGWTTDEVMPMGEFGDYVFIHQNGERIGAIFDPRDGHPARWRFYIRVPSINAAKDTVEQRGATLRMQPTQVPTGDYVITATDPQGAEFALVGRE